MSTSLRGCASAPVEIYDVALLDLDGVVYVGPDAVPGAAISLKAARERGMRLAFVTNNAARPPRQVADHLSDLGIAARAEEVVTSAQAAAHHLADRLPQGARVLVIGTTGLTEALRERGLTPVDDAQGQVDAVVEGYTPDLTWALFAEGAVAINRGVPWVATNTDRTIPSPRGPLPGNGAFVAAMALATGREPVVTGKPDPTMHRESVQRSGATHPLVVGDRLDTDIEGANAAGCDSMLVLTGVTTPGDLLRAPHEQRPTYLSGDLGGLLAVQPEPRLEDETWTCGGWAARTEDGRLQLRAVDARPGGSGAGDQRSNESGDAPVPDSGSDAPQRDGGDADLPDAHTVDALRALCAAWWARPAGDAPDVQADDDAAARALQVLRLTS